MNDKQPTRYTVNQDGLPPDYPTNLHASLFWEQLGRAVATFGHLEEALAKAVFALTATREIPDDEIEAEYLKWARKIDRTISDQLGALIDSFEQAALAHQDQSYGGIDDLVCDLRKVSQIRNVLCHGSWDAPDESGASLPFFVNRKKQVFETRIDIAFLINTRKHTADLICSVVNSVTTKGYQFPGSDGPGETIWPN